MAKTKHTLPKVKQERTVHALLLNIPSDVWLRMLNEAGLVARQVTPFIIEAITNRLDAEAAFLNKLAEEKKEAAHEQANA